MSHTEALRLALAGVVTEGDFTVPPYPAVALRLQRILATDRYGLADIADLIGADAALAATVLGAANSALFGVGPPITNLSRAVGRLGARTVSAIAVACGVSSAAVSAGVLLDVKFQVWRRTMTCALICQKLAPARGLTSEDAFLSGLLHGFGRSIAIASIERLIRGPRANVALSAEDWLQVAEQQRAPMARAISQAWQLPAVVADAIDDREPGSSALNDLVIDADAIAGELVAGRTPVAPRPGEAPVLEELCANLPAALDAFASAAGAASKLATPASRAVTKPEHALTGELRRAALVVADRHAKCATTLTCLTLSPTGIEALSSRRYQECAVVRLTIGDAGGDFEPWFTVALCVAEGSQHRVEFQLFSAPQALRERWQALHDAAERDPKTSSRQRVATPASLPSARASALGIKHG
jgi:HD-like signal output (HDOD) protein